MSGPLAIPVGQLASVGIGKEPTFGTFAVPTIFHGATQLTPNSKNTPILRPSSRVRAGMTYPATGGFDGEASLRVETTPDTFMQLMAFAMGYQTTPALAIDTTSTINSNYTGGSTTLVVASSTGVSIGDVCAIVGDANHPTVTNISGNTLTLSAGGFASSHSTGVTVTFESPTCYSSSIAFGGTSPVSTLPSFSLEFNRITDALDLLGCKINTMKLSLEPNKGLTADFGLYYANEAYQASPTTPVFSTKSIMTAEAPATAATYKGVAIGVSGKVALQKLDLSVANNLQKDYRSIGNGRQVLDFPLGSRKVTLSVTLGFESYAVYRDFYGGQSLTGPTTGAIPGVAWDFIIASTDLADSVNGLYFQIGPNLGNCFIESAPVALKNSGALTQTVTMTVAETSGGNNDLTIGLQNTAGFGY